MSAYARPMLRSTLIFSSRTLNRPKPSCGLGTFCNRLNMSLKGQKFSLDLDSDNFSFNVHDGEPDPLLETYDVVKEIRERDTTLPPPPPKLKSKSGFPEHRPCKTISAFKQQQEQNRRAGSDIRKATQSQTEPSDRAIAHHISQKYGIDPEAREKINIGEENKKRIAEMSMEDIEQARAELMSSLNPAFIERLLRRANIEEDQDGQDWDDQSSHTDGKPQQDDAQDTVRSKDSSVWDERLVRSKQPHVEDLDATEAKTPLQPPTSLSTHFPAPQREPSSYTPLDPNSSTFLADLKTHYFPDTPHDPSALTWLQDPTEEEAAASAYAPTQTSYAPSDIRFDFTGRLLPPSESSVIPVDKGLHHHGEAPESAGYTIPELSILVRSTMPNQRCVAYRTLGRILYRLGRGDFGPRGTELNEGLWGCVEHERPVEVMMSEANRTAGHASAKAYATEALWLWRRGGGGDRGVLKQGEKIAK